MNFKITGRIAIALLALTSIVGRADAQSTTYFHSTDELVSMETQFDVPFLAARVATGTEMLVGEVPSFFFVVLEDDECKQIQQSLNTFHQDFVDYMKEVVKKIPPNPNGKTKVWRVIHNDTDITKPIKPKYGTGLTKKNTHYTVEGHVGNGKRPNASTPYISSFCDKAKAIKRAQDDGCRVIEIDLTKVTGVIIDLTDKKVRETHLKRPANQNFAIASTEVLIITEKIPVNAVTGVEVPKPEKEEEPKKETTTQQQTTKEVK